MIDTARIPNFRVFVLWLIVMLAGVVILQALPEPDASRALLHYVPLHTSMEMVAVAVSAMIFGISWATQKYQPDGRVLALGVGFLGVALLDWTHALSNSGMPDFITHNDTEKSINFWLMARLCAALTFLLVAFWPTRLANQIGYQSRYWSLFLTALLVLSAHFVLLYFQESIPRTYTPGIGLTDLKIYAEYFLIALYITAGIGFLVHAKDLLKTSNVLLALASFTMAMSEFFFTLYANVADLYNVAGHVYKIIAYGFLYRGLFLVTVQRPFEALQKSEAHYLATLDALPDLLFEVDRQGVYYSIHASKTEKLAAPPDNIIGRRIEEMLPPEAARICIEAIHEADLNGTSHGHRIQLDVPLGQRYFELSIAKKAGQSGEKDLFLVLSRDITSTVESESKVFFEARLNATLLDLQERAEFEQNESFIRHSLALMQKLFKSPVALIYQVHDDQKGLSLLGRSEETVNNQGQASGDMPANVSSIAVSESGRWTDALLEHQPVVMDDQLSDADLRGLPSRLADVNRLISLPVMEADQVKLLIVLANMPKSYDEEELKGLQLFAATLWSMLKQNSKNLTINLLTEALEQSPHSVVITDTSAKIQYVNRAFCEISGYSLQEVIGENPRILQSGETPSSRYQELWAKLKDSESWQGEFTNRKKNGGFYDELVAIYPIKDRFGELTHYVAHKVDVTETKAAERRIRDLSDFDPLTGLLNKKSFYEKLSEAIVRADQRRELLTLLWFNLDNFKVINESLGHDAGDELLVEIASRLRESLGSSLTVARHSGDTFVAIIPKEKQSVVALIAADILSKLRAPVKILSQSVSVGASVGIAVFPEDAKTSGTLASAAEIAMYRAKDEGRNSLRFFASEMQQSTQRSLDLAVSLSGAHERGELYLVYQPQRSLPSGRTEGAEALLRWQHPKWGPVAPSEFIPIAEQTGLIVPIGQWVLEQVARQLHQWQAEGMPELLIAVNVSAVQFVRPGFVPELIKTMSKASVPTRCIEIEITEAVALKNSEQAIAIIDQLHEAGFRIALDDFGTGYSSLSYLRRYAIDKLKIDQSFVNELSSNEADQAIVLAIINMAKGLGMTTIAEGVETAEQASLLQALGCDALQGYWLSRPIPAPEFANMLQGKVVDRHL